MYADAFELLFDTAGITDSLAKVSMFRAGLDTAVDNAIVTSGTMPDIRDFKAWRSRAFVQYGLNKSIRTNTNIRTGPTSAISAPRFFPQVPASMPRSFAPAAPARANLQVPAPGIPVPMDVDRTRTRSLPPVVCYNCGLPGHVAKACTTPMVRQTDLLQEIIA